MKVFKTLLLLISIVLIGCKNNLQNKELSNEVIDSLMVKNTFLSSNGLKMPYRLFSPKSSDKKKPLLVFLHGRGDRGINNGEQIYREAGIITNSNSLLTKDMQEKYPCYILVPLCSNKTENEEWAKWVGNSLETPFKGLGKDGSYIMNDKPSKSGYAALELIEQLMTNHFIDSNRIYIIGLSMGGFSTWEFTARKPNLFAAAIPMAGYPDPSKLENIKHIPFWIFHGENDKWNPVQGSRNMYRLLKQKKSRRQIHRIQKHWSWRRFYTSIQ